MKPFLLLATRDEPEAADQEYDAFVRFGRLTESELIRRRLEREPLGEIRLGDYSGIILGGSPFTMTDPPASKSVTQHRVEAELAGLVDEVIARDFPFLGACYGIGIVGPRCGALVDRTYPEPVGPTDVTLTPDGREDRLLGVLPVTFQAFVGHKEAVAKLPDHVVGLATSTMCPVQAFRVGQNVYTTQFHPELDVPGILTRIEAYKHHGYFAADQAEALKQAAQQSDVHHPSAVVRRFVELYAAD